MERLARNSASRDVNVMSKNKQPANDLPVVTFLRLNANVPPELRWH